MQLNKLQLDLRPRPNSQALDLGVALLRVDGKQVYAAFLALWIPLICLCLVLALVFPPFAPFAMLLAWWLRPLLERAPLYVLSRNVFGETVSWRAAIRAWPGALRGGWFRLLTWWRFFMPQRGLYQAIWMLEGLRGSAASERRKVIGRDTAPAAYWFGAACVHFEVILEIGFIAFIGFFLTDENNINPFAFFFSLEPTDHQWLSNMAMLLSYAIAVGIIAPIYTASTFTLYLNRRATLEAWDVELMLRQLKSPIGDGSSPPAESSQNDTKAVRPHLASIVLPALIVAAMFSSMAFYSPPSQAQERLAENEEISKTSGALCQEPYYIKKRRGVRDEARNSAQAEFRKDVDAVYQHEDLRGYHCEEVWVLKNKKEKEKKKKETKKKSEPKYFELIALLIKILLIAAAVGFIAWLIYRFRRHYAHLFFSERAFTPTEISGLDIRPESLPDDITSEVWRLWQSGDPRAAMALLYRASISRLVHEFDVRIGRAATEQDCLQQAQQARAQQKISEQTWKLTQQITDAWLLGAYGARWLSTENLQEILPLWSPCFDPQHGKQAQRPGAGS